MRFICDFHIHSHYSIATSKHLNPEHLEIWARMKGIRVVGTGDFTHPGWAEELEEKLEPEGNGLFRLKSAYRQSPPFDVPESDVSFLLTAEISNIYKRDDQVRKVHNVVFAPDFSSTANIRDALGRLGNITSDGRPILGLDSRDLLEIVLEASDRSLFVPAHIWTPWFSALGAKSGFDSIEACYADLADHIHVVETGLSSDPPMNWLCSFLDRYTLISNSDAHSPEKLGREANIFDTDLAWDAIRSALITGDPERFLGTLEFFPQEGKYHLDGHRKCSVRWNPVETLKHDGLCPVCGKKITVGVLHRVMQLADREDPQDKPVRRPFTSIIPLKEILSEIQGVGVQSKKISRTYHTLIGRLGSEFSILMDLPLDEIKAVTNEVLAEAIRRMRKRDVYLQEGYDGEFGRITVFALEERKGALAQDSLFEESISRPPGSSPVQDPINTSLLKASGTPTTPESEPQTCLDSPDSLDTTQHDAVNHGKGPALVLAGPGSGKTRVLTSRIATLLQSGLAQPENCLAITFTNKAADEMRARLIHRLGPNVTNRLPVMTFHAFGQILIREQDTLADRPHRSLIDSEEKDWILTHILHIPKTQKKEIAEAITLSKLQPSEPGTTSDSNWTEQIQAYETYLETNRLLDLDDLIAGPVLTFQEDPGFLTRIRKRIRWILVDEFQDVNPAQYTLLRSIMPDQGANLFIIGDPDQAIYGFRGADARSIEHFRNDYPDASVYHLTTSYRCTNRILQVSRSVLLTGNSQETHALAGLLKGVKCTVTANRSDRGEAEWVARSIENDMGGLRFFSIDSDVSEGEVKDDITGLSDFAVLCRIHRQFDVMEKAFLDHSIPYQTVGESPFFKQEPVRSVIDLLRFAQEPHNPHLDRRIRASIHSKMPESWTERAGILRQGSVKQAVETIISQWLTKDREAYTDQLDRLLQLAEPFQQDFASFLNRTILGRGVDEFRPEIQNVTLMTLHAAKGLEFAVVFIIGCEDGLIPYRLHETACSMEEERRLLYVGMTRAKRYLFLSYADRRMLFGRMQEMKRSPLLDGIEDTTIEHLKPKSPKTRKKTTSQMDLF